MKRFRRPTSYSPELQPKRLRVLAKIHVRAFNRAHRRLQPREKDGGITAAFNRMEVSRGRLTELDLDWLEVVTENGPFAYIVLIGDGADGRPPQPLRFGLFDKDFPPVLPKEALALAHRRRFDAPPLGAGEEVDDPQGDLFKSFDERAEEAIRVRAWAAEQEPLVLRLEVKHNKASDLTQRRATAVTLKLLNEAGDQCYEEWPVLKVKSRRTDAQPTRLGTVIPVSFKTPADEIPPVTVKMVDDAKDNEDSTD